MGNKKSKKRVFKCFLKLFTVASLARLPSYEHLAFVSHAYTGLVQVRSTQNTQILIDYQLIVDAFIMFYA